MAPGAGEGVAGFGEGRGIAGGVGLAGGDFDGKFSGRAVARQWVKARQFCQFVPEGGRIEDSHAGNGRAGEVAR